MVQVWKIQEHPPELPPAAALSLQWGPQGLRRRCPFYFGWDTPKSIPNQEIHPGAEPQPCPATLGQLPPSPWGEAQQPLCCQLTGKLELPGIPEENCILMMEMGIPQHREERGWSRSHRSFGVTCEPKEKAKRMRGFTALSQSQFLTPNLGKLGWFCFIHVVPALSSALSPHLNQKMT